MNRLGAVPGCAASFVLPFSDGMGLEVAAAMNGFRRKKVLAHESLIDAGPGRGGAEHGPV